LLPSSAAKRLPLRSHETSATLHHPERTTQAAQATTEDITEAREAREVTPDSEVKEEREAREDTTHLHLQFHLATLTPVAGEATAATHRVTLAPNATVEIAASHHTNHHTQHMSQTATKSAPLPEERVEREDTPEGTPEAMEAREEREDTTVKHARLSVILPLNLTITLLQSTPASATPAPSALESTAVLHNITEAREAKEEKDLREDRTTEHPTEDTLDTEELTTEELTTEEREERGEREERAPREDTTHQLATLPPVAGEATAATHRVTLAPNATEETAASQTTNHHTPHTKKTVTKSAPLPEVREEREDTPVDTLDSEAREEREDTTVRPARSSVIVPLSIPLLPIPLLRTTHPSVTLAPTATDTTAVLHQLLTATKYATLSEEREAREVREDTPEDTEDTEEKEEKEDTAVLPARSFVRILLRTTIITNTVHP